MRGETVKNLERHGDACVSVWHDPGTGMQTFTSWWEYRAANCYLMLGVQGWRLLPHSGSTWLQSVNA